MSAVSAACFHSYPAERDVYVVVHYYHLVDIGFDLPECVRNSNPAVVHEGERPAEVDLLPLEDSPMHDVGSLLLASEYGQPVLEPVCQEPGEVVAAQLVAGARITKRDEQTHGGVASKQQRGFAKANPRRQS